MHRRLMGGWMPLHPRPTTPLNINEYTWTNTEGATDLKKWPKITDIVYLNLRCQMAGSSK